MKRIIFSLFTACVALNVIGMCQDTTSSKSSSSLKTIPMVVEEHPVVGTITNLTRVEKPKEGPMVTYSHVDVLKGCCALSYSPVIELEKLEETDDVRLFFREITHSESSFAGLTKKVGTTLVVAFPGTRTSHSMGTLMSDVKADISGLGSDGGFVTTLANTLAKKDIVAYPGFSKEVMLFYNEMFRRISSYDGISEIHFTGHSKGGGISILSALKYAVDSRVRFVKPSIKVFTFAAPPVLNAVGVDFFHDIIGEYNAICIYNNTDIVPYSSMFFSLFSWWGKDSSYRHVGIQANISKTMSKASDVKAEAEKIIADGIANGWSMSLAAKHLLKLSLASHGLDSFSCEAIREVMQRMRGRYSVNPYMDRNEIGRDATPFFASLMFWK